MAADVQDEVLFVDDLPDLPQLGAAHPAPRAQVTWQGVYTVTGSKEYQEKDSKIIIFWVYLCISWLGFSFDGNNPTIVTPYNEKYKDDLS